MLKRTTSCYVLAGFSRFNSSRRDETEEGKGEMEETTEKNRQIAGNLLGGKERWRRRETIYFFFSTISIFHQKWKFSVSILWVVQIFYQINSCLIVPADEMCLLSVRNSIQAAIHPNVSGMFLSHCMVQCTHMDLKNSGPTLYLLPRWATMLIIIVLKSSDSLC